VKLLASKYYSVMGKYFLLLIPLLIWGCDKTYDNVVDTSTENYQVTSIEGIKDTINLYDSPEDSLLNLKIIFTPESEVNKVYFSIFTSNNLQLNPSPVEMIEDSVNVFENQFIVTNKNPNGVYTIKFSAIGTSGINKQVALSNFNFINGQDSIPPVISNTVVDPDTVVVTQPTVIFTSVEAMDPNGASDILEVYFIVYRPDGTSNNNRVQMFDDGNISNGDVTAGDGIYSRLIQVDESNQKGTYRFEFQAKDRLGALSNIINHYVLIQ
jgi:hypothetical protein